MEADSSVSCVLMDRQVDAEVDVHLLSLIAAYILSASSSSGALSRREDAAERDDTNHLHSRGHLTGDCAAAPRASGSTASRQEALRRRGPRFQPITG